MSDYILTFVAYDTTSCPYAISYGTGQSIGVKPTAIITIPGYLMW